MKKLFAFFIVITVMNICGCNAIYSAREVKYKINQSNELIGFWRLSYDWKCNDKKEICTIFIHDNGIFDIELSAMGEWKLNNLEIVLDFNDGTKYKGKFSKDKLSIKGIIVYQNEEKGCWSADKMLYDLSDEIELMWETETLKNGNIVSTRRAQESSFRVFKQLENILIGLTKNEIVELLGNPNKNRSIYNFSLDSFQNNDLVYRFDTGNCGWQYNIQFGENLKAVQVKFLPIE